MKGHHDLPYASQVHAARSYFSAPEMLTDVAKLAKRAEWWGSPPQGRNVALYMECLADDDLIGAMETRDEILTELKKAKTKGCGPAVSATIWGLGIAVFASVVAAAYVLVLDPLVIGIHKAASAGVDAVARRF